MGPPKMVGAYGNRLEAGAGVERKRRDGERRDINSHCRDGNNDARDGVIEFRNGIGGGGRVTGGQWLQWGGVERGGGVKSYTHSRRPEIHRIISKVANYD